MTTPVTASAAAPAAAAAGEEGRLVDPLGRPLDDKGDIDTSETRPAAPRRTASSAASGAPGFTPASQRSKFAGQ